MAAAKRGRPYQVPEDNTPLAAATVDVDARVGWLLLMSRLHHLDPEMALGDSFIVALRRVGFQADRSAVSRWESGKVTPRYSVLVAYERALGLPPGQLTSVVNAQRRAFGGSGLSACMPVLDAGSDGFHERLDSLFDAILDGPGPGTGTEWTALAHHIAAAGTMYVQGAVWRQLSEELVNQTSRSVGVAYLQRQEAVRLLLEHRVAHHYLLTATGDYLDDPAVQVINDPMWVLELSAAPESAQVVLDKFVTTRSVEVLGAAAAAVANKVAGGCYTAEQINSIERALSRWLRRPTTTLPMFVELITALPQHARTRLLLASRGLDGHDQIAQSAAHGERFSPDISRRVAQRIADEVRSRLPLGNLYDDDKMTPRLIREALFSARGERIHHASLALVGSPFRTHLADVLSREIETYGLGDPIATSLTHLLRYLADSRQEERLLGWLPKTPPATARNIALTLGHLRSDRPLSQLLPLIRGDRSPLDRALIYGLGMRLDPALRQLAGDRSRPEYVRDGARWWMRQGGAIRL